MATRIQLQDLTKRFDALTPAGGGKGKTGGGTVAVDRVNLTIEPGELFFLLGPSGCGKTTLLRMIAGFIEPSDGRILFSQGPAADAQGAGCSVASSALGKGDANSSGASSARDVTFLPPNKRNTGMVFQSYALWPHMSVAENVGFGLDIRGVSGDERRRRILEALDAVQMGTYAERKPNQLSGGQQQRVALARALVIRPDVLLLDEPLSNLDAKLRNELRSEIRRICKTAGITGVYVTHDQKEALSMADRVAVINQGKVVQVAPPARLYRSPRNRFVAEFLGETNLMAGRIVEKRVGGGGGGTSGADAAGVGEPMQVIVETPVGRLVSSSVSRDVDIEKALDARNADDPAGHVLVSIRPEAVRVEEGDGMNNVFARVRESTYLGETAQWVVDVAGTQGNADAPAQGAEWKVAVLNPLATGLGPLAGEAATGAGALRLSVRPADVVVLPPPPAGMGQHVSGASVKSGRADAAVHA